MKQTEFLDNTLTLWMDDNHQYWLKVQEGLDTHIANHIACARCKIVELFDNIGMLPGEEILPGEPIPVPSLSAVLSLINKSSALVQWGANLAAEHFRDNLNHGNRINQRDIDRLYQEARFAHKRKSQEALDVGTAVHNYAEQYAKYHTEGGPEPDMPMEEQTLNGVLAFLDWVRKHKVIFHRSEFQLYSWDFNLAGTCDTIFSCDGKVVIGDFKTSKAIYQEYKYQVSFYRYAYEKLYHPIDAMAVIRFDKATGEFEFVELNEDSYLTNLLAVHGARELHYAIKGF